jgi:hypothetical protein
MLVVSELSEALEADRIDHHTTLERFQRAQDNHNPHSGVSKGQSFKNDFEYHIKDTFEDEIADAIIRLLDLSVSQGIDTERHVELKMRYNALREHKHGKQY